MLVDIMFQLLTALIEKAEKTKSVGLKCAPQSPLEEALFLSWVFRTQRNKSLSGVVVQDYLVH